MPPVLIKLQDQSLWDAYIKRLCSKYLPTVEALPGQNRYRQYWYLEAELSAFVLLPKWEAVKNKTKVLIHFLERISKILIKKNATYIMCNVVPSFPPPHSCSGFSSLLTKPGHLSRRAILNYHQQILQNSFGILQLLSS